MSTFFSRAKAVLDTAATVVVLVAAAATIYVILSRPARQSPSPQPEVYKVGDRIGQIAGLDFSASPVTLVLWLKSDCKFCTESMQFYQRLGRAPGRGRLVVIGAESQASLTAYVSEHGVTPDQVLSLPAQSLKVRGTPTLILVDRNGLVIDVRLGRINSPADEEAVLHSFMTTEQTPGTLLGG